MPELNSRSKVENKDYKLSQLILVGISGVIIAIASLLNLGVYGAFLFGVLKTINAPQYLYILLFCYIGFSVISVSAATFIKSKCDKLVEELNSL